MFVRLCADGTVVEVEAPEAVRLLSSGEAVPHLRVADVADVETASVASDGRKVTRKGVQ